jgi:hypothetical protein
VFVDSKEDPHMAIAVFSVPGVVSPLQGVCKEFWQWLNRPAEVVEPRGSSAPSAAGDGGSVVALPRVQALAAPRGGAPGVARRWSGPQRAGVGSAGAAAAQVRAARPLRVVKVMEGSRASSARVVISGRMADVCAELDRLAALEARGS